MNAIELDHDDDHFDFAANGTDRRWFLRALGVGGLGAVAASAALANPALAAAYAAIPEETAGPYPGDGTNGPNVLTQSGVVRSDIRSSFGSMTGTAGGVTTTIDLTLVDANDGAPLAGAAVYLWHCTREGGYSLYSSGITNQNHLRGVQVSDASGRVRFTTIFPGCYSGRWPHLHFEVYPSVSSISSASNALVTSQFALPQAACQDVYANASGYSSSATNLGRITLASDNVFRDGWSLQLMTATGSAAAGYALSGIAGVEAPVTVDPTADRNYVAALYGHFLGRTPDTASRDYWVGRLAAGTGRAAVAAAVAGSAEALGLVVDSYYGYVLGRRADTAGRAAWVRALQSGTTAAQLAAAMAAAPEFFAAAGGTNGGFVTAVYRRFLLRTPDSAGLAAWTARLDAGTPRQPVAFAVLDSLESRRLRVNAAYQRLLGRTPEAAGRDFWAGVVQSHGDLALARALAATDEYFARAQT